MAISINGIKVAGMGLPGKSAYQSAVDGGFVGTEEEFNKQLAEGGGGLVIITLPDGYSIGDPFQITEEESASLFEENAYAVRLVSGGINYILNFFGENSGARMFIASTPGESQNTLLQFNVSGTSATFQVTNYKFVPPIRTINNKPLSSNITLTAEDVGATTQEYVDGLVGNVNTLLDTINGEVV